MNKENGKENKSNHINIDNIPKDAKQIPKEQRDIITQGVKDGTIEHKQISQGIKNLIHINESQR